MTFFLYDLYIKLYIKIPFRIIAHKYVKQTHDIFFLRTLYTPFIHILNHRHGNDVQDVVQYKYFEHPLFCPFPIKNHNYPLFSFMASLLIVWQSLNCVNF